MIDVRDNMIDAAVTLLAQRGYQATSFHEVVTKSKSPRGSIYHHFPGGKDELIAAAITRQGQRAIALLDALEGFPPTEVTAGFLAMWRALLSGTGFSTGCSLVGVTVSAGDAALVREAGTVFRAWHTRLAELLGAGGVDPATATSFAALLLSASEGAVIIARAQKSLDTFEMVARQLETAASALSVH